MDIERVKELSQNVETKNKSVLLNYEYIVYDLKITAIKDKSLDKTYAIDPEAAPLVVNLLVENGFDAKLGIEFTSGEMKKTFVHIKSPILEHERIK